MGTHASRVLARQEVCVPRVSFGVALSSDREGYAFFVRAAASFTGLRV